MRAMFFAALLLAGSAMADTLALDPGLCGSGAQGNCWIYRHDPEGWFMNWSNTTKSVTLTRYETNGTAVVPGQVYRVTMLTRPSDGIYNEILYPDGGGQVVMLSADFTYHMGGGLRPKKYWDLLGGELVTPDAPLAQPLAGGDVTNIRQIGATEKSIILAWNEIAEPVRAFVYGSNGGYGEQWKDVFGNCNTWELCGVNEWEIFGTYAWPLQAGTCYRVSIDTVASGMFGKNEITACTLDEPVVEPPAPELTPYRKRKCLRKGLDWRRDVRQCWTW